MSSSRYVRALGPALLLAVGGAYALASWNWCGVWQAGSPAVVRSGRADGAWQAGAARVALVPPYPVVPAGYAPPRPTLTSAEPPLHARAIVVAAGEVKVGIVALDLLTVSPELTEAIRVNAIAAAGLSDVLVVATHAHSSFGGYDPRLVSQLAGTGRYREDAVQAAADGAVAALSQAAGALKPVTLEIAEGTLEALVHARSGDAADARALRLVLRGETRVVAELWVASAHPALEPRPVSALSPDYPGQVEEEGGPVTLVLQGAGGNARAVPPEGAGRASSRFAAALAERVRALEVKAPAGDARKSRGAGDAGEAGEAGEDREPDEAGEGGQGAQAADRGSLLAFARVRVELPRPDASRLAPWFARAAGDNLLCQSSAKSTELFALQLGPVRLLGVPGEPTLSAAKELEPRGGATRVVGLAGGYLGYVESAELVRAGAGESKRQYFRAELLDALGAAAATADGALN